MKAIYYVAVLNYVCIHIINLFIKKIYSLGGQR